MTVTPDTLPVARGAGAGVTRTSPPIRTRGSTSMIDTDLKQTIENALDFEPSLDASDIGVSVDEGVVTLCGNVVTYSEKYMEHSPDAGGSPVER